MLLVLRQGLYQLATWRYVNSSLRGLLRLSIELVILRLVIVPELLRWLLEIVLLWGCMLVRLMLKLGRRKLRRLWETRLSWRRKVRLLLVNELLLRFRDVSKIGLALRSWVLYLMILQVLRLELLELLLLRFLLLQVLVSEYLFVSKIVLELVMGCLQVLLLLRWQSVEPVRRLKLRQLLLVMSLLGDREVGSRELNLGPLGFLGDGATLVERLIWHWLSWLVKSG